MKIKTEDVTGNVIVCRTALQSRPDGSGEPSYRTHLLLCAIMFLSFCGQAIGQDAEKAKASEADKMLILNYIRLSQTDPMNKEAFLRNYLVPMTKDKEKASEVLNFEMRISTKPNLDLFQIKSVKGEVVFKGRVLRVDQRDVLFLDFATQSVYSLHIGEMLADAMKYPLVRKPETITGSKKAVSAGSGPKNTGEMSLEEMIAKALKDNPDIRVAEAKMRTATVELDRFRELVSKGASSTADLRISEAKLGEMAEELNRTRLKVINGISILLEEIRSAQAQSEEAATRYKTQEALTARQASPVGELRAAKLTMWKYSADLEKLRTELQLMLGQTTPLEIRSPVPSLKESPPPETLPKVAPQPDPVVEKLQSWLNEPVKADFDNVPLNAIFENLLRDQVKGLNVVSVGKAQPWKATVKWAETVPVGALIQWIEDKFDCVVLLRDYGLVIVKSNEIPQSGAVMLGTIWRQVRKQSPLPHSDPLFSTTLRENLNKLITPKFEKVPAKKMLEELFRENGINANTVFFANEPSMLAPGEIEKMAALVRDPADIARFILKSDFTLNQPVPLHAALQWFEDQFGWKFYVRDYGIAVVERDRVLRDGVTLREFMKGGK